MYKYCNNFQQYLYPYFAVAMPSPYGPPPTLHRELAGFNNRPVDTAGGQRLQIGVDSTSTSEVPASYYGNTFQSEPGGRGSSEAAGQGGNSEGESLPRPVHQQNFPGPQEGWFIQTSGELEATQSVLDSCPLQDGEPGNDEGPTEGRRLDGLHRLKGCVPVSHSLGGASEVPSVLMDGGAVRVPVPAIRAMQCTQGLHEVVEANA